jgi:hypothetical protein
MTFNINSAFLSPQVHRDVATFAEQGALPIVAASATRR